MTPFTTSVGLHPPGGMHYGKEASSYLDDMKGRLKHYKKLAYEMYEENRMLKARLRNVRTSSGRYVDHNPFMHGDSELKTETKKQTSNQFLSELKQEMNSWFKIENI